MTTAKSPVTVRLSQEELLFVLRTINIPSLPGIGEQPFGQANDETITALLNAAGRALMARNMLAMGADDTLHIDQGVYAAATICAHPDQMVALLDRRRGQATQQHYFYRVPQLAVTHTIAQAGLHDITMATTSDMGQSLANEILQALPAGANMHYTARLTRDALAAIQQAAHEDAGTALWHAHAAGIEAAPARVLVAALAAPHIRLSLQFVPRVQPTVEQHILTVVADDTTCWMIYAGSLQAEQVTIQSLPAAKVLQVVQSNFIPFMQALRNGRLDA
jgi:hypothetical protein